MACSVLRTTATRCAIVSGTAFATAVGVTVQKRFLSQPQQSRKPKRRFTGQVAVYGRSDRVRIEKCLEDLECSSAVGVTFDYDWRGRITAIKVASHTAAIVFPVADGDQLLSGEVQSLLSSRQLLKVMYNGFDDVVQLEKRFGVRLGNFSDVYLDAARLHKPVFPGISGLVQHCCDISLDADPLPGNSVDYRSKAVGLRDIMHAAKQAWALTVLRGTLVQEADTVPAAATIAASALPVYASSLQYLDESELIKRVQRSAGLFVQPMQNIAGVLAQVGVGAASTSEHRPVSWKDGGSAGRGGSAGPGAGSGGQQRWRRSTNNKVEPAWNGLPLDNDSLLQLAAWHLQQHPLTSPTVTTATGSSPGVRWLGGAVTQSCVHLPCGSTLAMSTNTAVGTGAYSRAACVDVTDSSEARHQQESAVMSSNHDSQSGDKAQWNDFAKQEVRRMKSRLTDLLNIGSILSIMQPSCHGSVSVMTDQHLLRLYSEAQSLRAVQQSCLPSASRPSSSASLHNLVTGMEVVSRASCASSCMAPPPAATVSLRDIINGLEDVARLHNTSCIAEPPPLPKVHQLIEQLSAIDACRRLQPTFKLPCASLPFLKVPSVDVTSVHSHFRQHYRNVSQLVASLGPVRCSAPVDAAAARVMASSTSMFAVRLS